MDSQSQHWKHHANPASENEGLHADVKERALALPRVLPREAPTLDCLLFLRLYRNALHRPAKTGFHEG